MNDEKLIRECVKDISGDLIEEASVFAHGAAETPAPAVGASNAAPAAGKRAGRSGKKNFPAGLAVAASIAVLFLVAGIAAFSAYRNRREREKLRSTDPVSILTPDVPFETETPAPPTYVPTAAPSKNPSPELTEAPTPAPATVPTQIPTETPEPANTPEPTATPEPTPEIPDYYISYSAWLKWREDNPEEYALWKNTDFPEKDHVGKGIIDEQWFYTSSFGNRFTERVCNLPREFAEAMGYYDPSVHFSLSDPDYKEIRKKTAYTDSWPGIVYEIEKYGVPKEELLEFAKWQTASPYYNRVELTRDDVELIYSEDIDRMRQEYIAYGAFLYEGRIYTYYEVEYFIDTYDLGRIFTTESLTEYLEKEGRGALSPAGFQRAREEYERIFERDKGELKVDTAAELLAVIFDLYDGLRFDPDKWALEGVKPVFDYRPSVKLFWKATDLYPPTAQRQLYTVMEPGLAFGVDVDGNITNRFRITADMGGDPGGEVYNADPAFYDGPVIPFGDNYKLIDHVKIVDNSDSRAKVNIRCLCRDGVTEKTYTAEFTKDCGKWRISGGTVLELLTDTAAPTITIDEAKEALDRRDKLAYLENYGLYKPLKAEDDFVTVPAGVIAPDAETAAYAYTKEEWNQIRDRFYAAYSAETAAAAFGDLDARAVRYDGMILLEKKQPAVKDIVLEPAMRYHPWSTNPYAFNNLSINSYEDGKIGAKAGYELYGVEYTYHYSPYYIVELVLVKEEGIWKVDSFEGTLQE
jgi:hypothetical protein